MSIPPGQSDSEPPTAGPVILIVGPTAGGKTALSLDLAEALDGECLCADSMQVYRGMDIGTAKPTAEEQARVPHHLLDLVDPPDPFSVDLWLGQAEAVIQRLHGHGKLPIVVGGTNLYIQSLLWGMMEGPPPDDTVRATLAAMPGGSLRAELEAVDPEAANRIHPNDRRRTIRALEVFRLTGRSISEQQGQWEGSSPTRNIILIGLDYPAEIINPRINRRVRRMMEEGLLEEVRGLYHGVGLGAQAVEALGYRQLVDHLLGRRPLEAAVEEIKIRTRRFAKHQRTWFRRFRARTSGCWISCSDGSSQHVLDQSLEHIMAQLAKSGEKGPRRS